MSVMGTVFHIQRFSINDGPGIRTCVFMKGCPLNCLWCHNPESNSAACELSYMNAKCIGCGKCVSACKNGCHSFENGIHAINRVGCNACGGCASVCSGALEIFGKKMSAEEVIFEALKDRMFYESSNGGITFTGGEPFAQSAFLLAMLKEAKKNGLHVCIETCGYVKPELLRSAMNYVDLFLYDYKETDASLHKQYTGADNRLILENLKLLANSGKRIVLRCPIIPGYNDREAHFAAIAQLAESYPSVIEVNVEPYHPLGKTKAEQIGKAYALPLLKMADKQTEENWINAIQRNTSRTVKRA